MSQSRNWTFTFNNPTPTEDLSCIKENPLTNLLVANLEIGTECLTPHYQGYLELKQPRRLTFVKTLLPTAHWEIRRGSKEQAANYCLKDILADETNSSTCTSTGNLTSTRNTLLEYWMNMTLQEAGTMGLQLYDASKNYENVSNFVSSLKKDGKRTSEERLLKMKCLIDEGKNDLDLAEEDFSLWLKYYKNLMYYRTLITPKRNNKVNVLVIIGPTGTGKSKYVHEKFPDAYWKQKSQWWDNYHQHEVVIFDEFYGWIPYDTLLRICDRYPLQVEIKGGQVELLATTLVFTSNVLPEKWYKNVYFAAFKRRVTTWMCFNAIGDETTHQDYESLAKRFINFN